MLGWRLETRRGNQTELYSSPEKKKKKLGTKILGVGKCDGGCYSSLTPQLPRVCFQRQKKKKRLRVQKILTLYCNTCDEILWLKP